MSKEQVLSELIHEISMGPFGSDIKVDNFIEKGVPVLNGSNLSGFTLSESSFKYVSKEKANTFKKAVARRGDIVITHRGTLGQISYIPESSSYDRYVISQSQFRVRFKDEYVDPAYLVYLFHSKYGQKKLLSFKNHVGVPALAQATTNFRKLKIRLPDLTVQKQIAAVLSCLDTKIELNNKINAQLEKTAKILYDFWFVQFDFPNNEGKPYKLSGGKMVYNEVLKREIPVGWHNLRLSEIANITMGQSPIGESFNDNENGTIFFQGCTDFGWRFPLVRKYTTQPTRFAKRGDILLSVRAPVGRLNVADENCCIGRGLAAINCKVGFSAFIFNVLHNFKQVFDRRNVNGTTFGSITKEDLFSLPLAYPPKPLMQQFEDKIQPLNKQILANHKQNRELLQLRDWLLPLFISEQIKVSGT